MTTCGRVVFAGGQQALHANPTDGTDEMTPDAECVICAAYHTAEGNVMDG